MSKGKKKENNFKNYNEHYEQRAVDRPVQRWVMPDGKPAPKKEAEGAIPIRG